MNIAYSDPLLIKSNLCTRKRNLKETIIITLLTNMWWLN